MKSTKRYYDQWDEEQKQKLASLVDDTQQSRIVWDNVASLMGNRTAQQCKSFYQNILKKQLHIETKQNKKWTFEEKSELFCSVLAYNRNWDLVREKHFSSFSNKQLQQAFRAVYKEFSAMHDQIRMAQSNPNSLQEQSLKMLHKVLKIIKLADYRINFEERKSQMTDLPELAQHTTFFNRDEKLDIEKQLDKLWDGIDSQKVMQIYEDAIQFKEKFQLLQKMLK